MDTLVIDENTRISELIKWNKESINAIATLSKPLEKLKNPILRKLMASRVTIREAAKMGGCTIHDFQQILKPLGFEFSQGLTEEQQVTGMPAWIYELPKEAIHIFDVRDILAGGEDPLKKILNRFKSIPPNEALCIINTFDPVPLTRLLEKDGVLTFSQEVNTKEYHTYFYKKTMSSPYEMLTEKEFERSSSNNEKVQMMDQTEFEDTFSHFNNVREIDVRALSMPGPMETILSILPDLEPNQLLYVHHKRVPLYLLEEIVDEDYRVCVWNRGADDVKLLIYRL